MEGPTLEATQILKQCRRRTEEDLSEIEVEEVKNGFRRWNAKTSTSPLGLHLGITKSFTDTDEQEK